VAVASDLLGLPPDYAARSVERIGEFAELGAFFDRPVACYSRGMRTRLAFSLFAFLESDVLVLDESLAGGDLFFRERCYQRLDEIARGNTAVLLVTHRLEAVQQYCRRVLVLDGGLPVFQGPPEEGVARFRALRRATRTTGQ